jgi:cation:H+ antiporter
MRGTVLELHIALFIAGAAVILWSGSRLPVLARSVAVSLGIGATTIGLFVLALITSLPEFAVTLTAVLKGTPDLALGNVLGSNNFNIAMIVVIEFVAAKGVFLAYVDKRRFTRTCALVAGFTLFVGLGVMLGWSDASGIAPILVVSLPIAAVFIIESFLGGRGVLEQDGDDGDAPTAATSGQVAQFIGLAALVVGAGVVVSFSADVIATHPFSLGGRTLVLGHTFVGSLFVAIATSLPEVTVSIGAVRHARCEDMALGTLLGSNSLNILIFAVGAPLLWFRGGTSGWAGLEPANLTNVVVALLLTGLVFAAMRVASRGTPSRLSRSLIALMVPVYLAGLCFVFRGGL